MKWFKEGKAYDIETAIRVGRKEYEIEINHAERPCEGTLYRTRGGAYFVHERFYAGDSDDTGEPFYRDRMVPYSAAEAEKWMLSGDVEVYNNTFDDPPEAEAQRTEFGELSAPKRRANRN